MIERSLYRLVAPLLIPLAVACGSGESKGIAISPESNSSGISIQLDKNARIGPVLSVMPPTSDNSLKAAERITKVFERENDSYSIQAGKIDTSSNPALGLCLDWPIEGALQAYFTRTHPFGIDIDAYGEKVPIKSPAPAKVVFTGGDPTVGYGNYIVLDHGLGVKTLYGHLSEIGVKKDEIIDRGSNIGITGMSGWSTGYHLHFELWQELNGTTYRYNPLDYLDNNLTDKTCTHR